MMGLIVPGGWEEFFRFIGEPYSGPTWPLNDDRNFFEVLLPKLEAAAAQFDMVPCPQQKSFDPQPWPADDNRLPGKVEPYFLKNATGPAYLHGGMVSRPLVTMAESNGKFAIGTIEGSTQHHSSSLFGKELQRISFADVHHAFLVNDGTVEFQIDMSSSRLHAGDLVYVPKATTFRFRITSRFAKIYAFYNGGGMVELLRELGKEYKEPVIPEKADSTDFSKMSTLQSSFGGLKFEE